MQTLKLSTLTSAVALATVTTLAGCGGSSSSSGGARNADSTSDLPVLQMAGGRGGADEASGGSGDYFEVENRGGGDIVLGDGKAPSAGFTATNLGAAPTELGDKPLVVAADMSLGYVADFAAKPGPGTYYLSGTGGGGYVIRLSDGDTAAFNAAEVVTGVEITGGRTLTLGLNNGTSAARLDLEYDLLVKGTLKTADVSGTERGDLDIYANSVLVWPTGMLSTAGEQEGQNAGAMNIYPNYSFINHGKILSYGADSAAGDAGDGDVQYVYADGLFENTGLMDAHGGKSTTGYGGDAGWINLYSGYGDCVSSGKVLAYGGFGELGGGDGDDIYFYADSVGDVKISGTVAFYGGDGGSDANADGGDADYLYVYVYGGAFHSTAAIQGWGGDSQGADGSGGEGGDIDIYNYSGGHYETSPPEGIYVAGTIAMDAGDALASGTGDGGYAGYVYAYLADDSYALGQDVVFRFSKLDMRGGNGNYGGDGGDYYVYNYEGYNDVVEHYVPSGTIYSKWMVDGSGGDVVATATGNGDGGAGSEAYVESDYYQALGGPEFGLVKIAGNLDLSGGESLNSTSNSSSGDETWIWGYNGVTFANINAAGGSDRASDGGTDGYGGTGGDVEIYSELGNIKGGTVNVSGGNGEYDGGSAGYFDSEGQNHAYALKANGGNANASLAGSVGGDVNGVYIWSEQGNSGVNVTVQRKAGTGSTPGDEDSSYLMLGTTCAGLDC